MPLHYETLKNWKLPPIRQSYTERDVILYAIGVGVSVDPIEPADLAFLYEGRGPVTLPTIATVIGQRPMWMDDPELGLDWRKIVHGEQMLTQHAQFPPAATIVSEERVTDIFDKGADKGAVVWMERSIRNADDGVLYTTLQTCYFLRADGGFGGATATATTSSRAIPDRVPNGILDLPTRNDQAILYRLSGDINPLHIDVSLARKAGFPAPILHGLCTYGISARAIIAVACDGDPARLAFIGARFSAPTYPGETIRTEYWRLDDETIAFRCRAVERDVIILTNGEARIRPTKI